MDNTISISKEVLPCLEGFGFTETILGDPKGSLKQYRNSRGVHVREYMDRFEIHEDRIDPQTNPVGHLLVDSPETIVAFVATSLITANRKNTKSSHFFGNPFGFLLIFLSLNNILGRIKRLIS
jgi:hypothetical protein